MSIAAGNVEEAGILLNKIEPEKYINNLTSKRFNGYICVTIAGKTGIEDGMIFFEKGAPIIANYVYFKYNTEYKKEEALERCTNALRAEYGVVDLFSTTDEQTRLIKTLKEEEMVEKQTKISVPKEFSYKYEELLLKKESKGATKEDILKKYGITSLRTTEASKEGLMFRAGKEDLDIRELVKK